MTPPTRSRSREATTPLSFGQARSIPVPRTSNEFGYPSRGLEKTIGVDPVHTPWRRTHVVTT